MTIYIQAHAGEAPDHVDPEAWKPWINTTDREQLRAIAAHRLLRDRGGLSHGETLSVTVWDFKQGDLVHENGNPLVFQSTVFNFSKQ